MLVLTQNQAKAKADTLHKFLTERGITLPKSDMLNAVARMAGFEDWNAMAAQYQPEAVDAQFDDDQVQRIYDGLETSIQGYGPECVVQVASGLWLAAPPYRPDAELDYVRVCDQLGRELVYWSADEFTENAPEVLGALVGVLNQSRTDLMPNPGNPVADKLVVADRSPKKQKASKKRTGLSEMDWDKVYRIGLQEPDSDETEYHQYNHSEDDVLAALDAERNGEADEEDLELLDLSEDDIVLDWGDEYEAEGLTAGELRGMKPLSNGCWELKDGRQLGFMRLEMIM